VSSRVPLKTNTLKRIGLGTKVSKADSKWESNATIWGQANINWEALWLLTYNKVPRPNQALTTRINKPVTVLTRVSKPVKPLYTRV